MYIPDSFSTALTLMIIGMACWGSWANAFKLTRDWRFELFYWDYTIGIVLFSAASLATLGGLFGEPTAWQNLLAADRATWFYAAAAGAIWNVGNLLLMAGIAMIGIAVAFPVAVGLALVLGVTFSYMAQPRGSAMQLALGVACVFAAVIVNSLAYRTSEAAKPQTAKSGGSMKGLVICVVAGLLISLTGPFVARCFAATPPLSSYGVMMMFTLGAVPASLAMLPFLMRRPVQGAPLAMGDYWRGGAVNHAWGFAGAVVWGLGSAFNFIGAEKTAVALAQAVGQANPLVAALWGVFVWKEFRGAPRRTHLLLAAMFVLYLAGLIILSR